MDVCCCFANFCHHVTTCRHFTHLHRSSIAIFSPMDLGCSPNFSHVLRFLSHGSSLVCKKRLPETCYLNFKFSSKFWMSIKVSNASLLTIVCTHESVISKVHHTSFEGLLFLFVDVSIHIDIESKCLAKKTVIENWKSRCGNWLQVCNLSLEIGFVARCNGGSHVCNKTSCCNNDYSIWKVVDIWDLKDDEWHFGTSKMAF